MPTTQTVSPTGIAPTRAFGTPVVSRGPVTISPAGFFEEGVGSPTVAIHAAQFVRASGFAEAEALGTPTVTLSGPTTIYPVGIPPS